MLDSVETQLWRLSALFLLGTGCNLLFNLYTAARAVFRPGRIMRHLLDAITALLTFGLVLAVVFAVSYGELRFYVPLSIAVGFMTSQFFIGRFLYSAFLWAFRAVSKGLRWLKWRVVSPFVQTVKRILKSLTGWINPPDPT